MKMRGQMMLAFSLVLGLVLISSVLVYWQSTKATDKLERFEQVRVSLVLAAGVIDSDREVAKSELRAVFLAVRRGDISSARASRQRFQEAWKEINTTFAPLPELSKGFEVIGSAANGKIALQKVRELNPDVLTLDIEMPELDGLAVLDALFSRKTWQ